MLMTLLVHKLYALGVSTLLEQSQGSTGTAMCMLKLKSDMCVIAHDHILLKYLSDHELWRQLQAARTQVVSSRRLSR